MTVDLADFLARASLQGLRKNANGYLARCPAHVDRTPSLSIGEGDDGCVLVKCHAGCELDDILAALDLEARDLFADDGRGGGGASYPSRSPATAQPRLGCTLAQYAEAKALPLDFLRGLGLSDMTYQGAPAVRVPYLDADGTTAAVRFRLALAKAAGGDQRFAWRSGDKPTLYGLQRLSEARAAGWVVLLEGESDAQTLWCHDIPALGLPGANLWRAEWAELLDGLARVYVVVEPDSGGEAVLKWLAASPIRERALLVRLPDGIKDPSELYLRDRAAFADRWRGLLAAAASWSDQAKAAAEASARQAWECCASLASQPRILDLLPEVLEGRGVVGETRAAKLIYLALTTRLLGDLLSVAVKGPSSGGKSFVTENVVELFPPSAVYVLSSMSEHALAYLEEPLSHRFLVLYEAAGMQNDLVGYLIRSLLSEGQIRYATVEKTKDGLRQRTIELEGPTGLLVTTTSVRLHPENETRVLSVSVDDTQEQTRAVMRAIARRDAPQTGDDRQQWLALQIWLEGAEHRVVVPFGEQLADLVPPVAVRLRRDFKAVMILVTAHALLHQASRKCDAHGRVVATLDDYAAIHEIVAELVGEGVQATVSQTMRETVAAVAALRAESDKPVTYARLGTHLGIDKSAASRRARVAIAAGYLTNEETRRGRPAVLRLGEPLPEEIEILPCPAALAGGTQNDTVVATETPPQPRPLDGCTVADESSGIENPPPPTGELASAVRLKTVTVAGVPTLDDELFRAAACQAQLVGVVTPALLRKRLKVDEETAGALVARLKAEGYVDERGIWSEVARAFTAPPAQDGRPYATTD